MGSNNGNDHDYGASVPGGLRGPTRHPLLEQLAKDRAGLRTQFALELRGTKYTFELLGPEGDEWVGAATPAINLVAWSLESRKYRFAAALRSIALVADGHEGRAVPIEDLWPLPEDEPARRAIEGEGDARSKAKSVRAWRRLQIVEYLEGLDSQDLRAFENEYSVHNEKRMAAFRGAEPGNFSMGTPSPSSEATSSPEKAS